MEFSSAKLKSVNAKIPRSVIVTGEIVGETSPDLCEKIVNYKADGSHFLARLYKIASYFFPPESDVLFVISFSESLR